MQELIDKIYIGMGVTTDILPLDIVTFYLNEWTSVYPDPTQECLVLYNTVVSCYEWLIKQSAASDSSEGVVKREKEQNIEIEMFERKSGDNTQLWIDSLERFESNPSLVFPSCRDTFKLTPFGRVIVGGVKEDKIKSINNNRNIRTGGASERCGVRWGSTSYRRNTYKSSFRLPSDDC